MQMDLITQIALPISIIIMMLNMGLALTPEEFRYQFRAPKAVAIGLFNQLLMLPIIGILVITLFQLNAAQAAIIILIAAAPGGPVSNLIVHLSDGDRALSVTLTTISSGVAFLSFPLIVNFALIHLIDGTHAIQLPVVPTIIQIAILTILPVMIGMGIRRRNAGLVERNLPRMKRLSSVLFVVVLLSILWQYRYALVSAGPTYGPALIALNCLAMSGAYLLGMICQLRKPQLVTIAVETGIQNAGLALTIALALFGEGEIAGIVAVYGLWMLLAGFGFAFVANRGSKEVQKPRLAYARG